METIALIAAIVSIILAGFAIWQANHQRDQSDKLNRDTTEKLARIEACATSTEEDAFAELKETYGWLRAGGKVAKGLEQAKENEVSRIKTIAQEEINKVLEEVEDKLRTSGQDKTISDIEREFQQLKREIGQIQDKTVVGVQKAEKKSKVLGLLGALSVEEKAVLKEIARSGGKATNRFLRNQGHGNHQIAAAIELGARDRLVSVSRSRMSTGTPAIVYVLDPELAQVLKE